MTEAWPSEREDALRTLWGNGLTASQCARELGCGITRNAVIGKVHRLKLEKRGASSVKATKATGGRGGAGKYRGVASAAQKARTAKLKDKAFRAPPPEVFKPDADDLAVGAWSALPDTVPVSLDALSHDSCRWPIGEDAPFLFCGCKAAAGSSYCATHRHRSKGVGTPSEQTAPRAAQAVARLERSYGFRSAQAGQSL